MLNLDIRWKIQNVSAHATMQQRTWQWTNHRWTTNKSARMRKIPSEIISYFTKIHSLSCGLYVVLFTSVEHTRWTYPISYLIRWLGTRATPDKRPLTWLVSYRLRKLEVFLRKLWAITSVCETSIIRCVCFYFHSLSATIQRKRRGGGREEESVRSESLFVN